METVGSAGDWDRENENHGPAICPLLWWQKFCPGWKQSVVGNDPKSLHQQETPTVSPQEPDWKTGWHQREMTKSFCHCCQHKSQRIFALLILQPSLLIRWIFWCVPMNLNHMIRLAEQITVWNVFLTFWGCSHLSRISWELYRVLFCALGGRKKKKKVIQRL